MYAESSLESRRRDCNRRARVHAQTAVADAASPLLELLYARGGLSGWSLVGWSDGHARVLATAGRARLAVGETLERPPWLPGKAPVGPVLVPDVSGSDAFDAPWPAGDVQSAVLAPVTVHGETVAVATGLTYDRAVEYLQAYAAPAAAVADTLGRLWQAHTSTLVERHRADVMEGLALTDGLTGLPNRRAWDMGLRREGARVQRHGHNVVVVVVDLDELKHVNDRGGHAAGDALIRKAAETLKSAIRDGDVLARIGGDEFGIVAVHCDEADAEPIRERVAHALAAVGIAASVGAALGGSTDGSLAGAWDHADALMYVAKRDQHRGRTAAV